MIHSFEDTFNRCLLPSTARLITFQYHISYDLPNFDVHLLMQNVIQSQGATSVTITLNSSGSQHACRKLQKVKVHRMNSKKPVHTSKPRRWHKKVSLSMKRWGAFVT